MRAGILDRYLFMAWLKMYGVCQAGFLGTYLVVDILEKYGRFSRSGSSLQDMLFFFLLKLPEMFGQTASFSVLMATLLSLGAFSRSSELTAMRSCGISIVRIALPVVAGGVLVTCLTLLNAEFVVPSSFKQLDYIEKIKIKKQDAGSLFRLNNIWFRFDTMMLQAKAFDPAAVVLRGVTVWEISDRMQPVSRTDAATAVQEANGTWVLRDASVRRFVNGTQTTAKVDRFAIPLQLKREDLRVYDKRADNLSFRELNRYASTLERGGYDAGRFKTLMYAKIAVPFAACVMVLLGIPFALKTGRSGGAAKGIAFTVAIGFTYFMLHALIVSYGKSGALPPLVAAWGANLLFVLAGIWLAMTVRQQ